MIIVWYDYDVYRTKKILRAYKDRHKNGIRTTENHSPLLILIVPKTIIINGKDRKENTHSEHQYYSIYFV